MRPLERSAPHASKRKTPSIRTDRHLFLSVDVRTSSANRAYVGRCGGGGEGLESGRSGTGIGRSSVESRGGMAGASPPGAGATLRSPSQVCGVSGPAAGSALFGGSWPIERRSQYPCFGRGMFRRRQTFAGPKLRTHNRVKVAMPHIAMICESARKDLIFDRLMSLWAVPTDLRM